LLRLGAGALGVLGGCTYKFSLWITPNFFYPPWGCRCTHCTPWLRLWRRLCDAASVF